MTVECNSFPYAFRAMYNTVQVGVEKGKTVGQMCKNMRIISPLKDLHGDHKTYSYPEAVRMATQSGLLSADGQLNGKEFRR